MHAGILFPPEYEPHGVRMLYEGKPVELTTEQVLSPQPSRQPSDQNSVRFGDCVPIVSLQLGCVWVTVHAISCAVRRSR